MGWTSHSNARLRGTQEEKTPLWGYGLLLIAWILFLGMLSRLILYHFVRVSQRDSAQAKERRVVVVDEEEEEETELAEVEDRDADRPV